MRRMSIPSLMLAVLLALLLPLEQAHCVWMGLQAHSAPGAASGAGTHACCAGAAKSASATTQPAPVCNCILLPLVTLPGVVAVVGEAPATPVLVPAVAAGLSSAPEAVAARIVPAVDVGSPPLPAASGAHGLRAPPIPA